MYKYLIIILTFCAGIITSRSYACMSDAECGLGSQCYKHSQVPQGVCITSSTPGYYSAPYAATPYPAPIIAPPSYHYGYRYRYNYSAPYYSPVVPGQSYGNMCSVDIDCAAGLTCVKTDSPYYGLCLRG